MSKGLFISFEGIDGAGKTTQINMLKAHLEGLGYTVTVTREPGGSELCNKIRNILLDKDNKELCSMAELLLYYADRAQHINEVIAPKIANGECIICDRYYDSSYAYQLAGRKISEDILDELNDLVVKDAHPDLTFLLDLTLDVSLQRVSGRGESDRLELEGLSFKQRVRDGFLAQAQKHPERICVVDASQSPDGIFNDILSHLEKRGIKA